MMLNFDLAHWDADEAVMDRFEARTLPAGKTHLNGIRKEEELTPLLHFNAISNL
jgi:hypothetical protein